MSEAKTPQLQALEFLCHHAQAQTKLLERIAAALEKQPQAAARTPASTATRREDRPEIFAEGELQGIGSKGRLAWAWLVKDGVKLKLKASGEHQGNLEAHQDGDQVRIKHSGLQSDDRGEFVWVGGIEMLTRRAAAPVPAPDPMPGSFGGTDDDIPFDLIRHAF